MSKFKTRSLLMAVTVAVLAGPLAAQAQTTWTNSAMYNGFGANNMNSASSYSMRDANGNLTMVNG